MKQQKYIIHRWLCRSPLLLSLPLIAATASLSNALGEDKPDAPVTADPWAMHQIDGGSRGADGVRLADFNGDGFPDSATGWEEGAEIRICLNPGPGPKVTSPWQAFIVGRVKAPEDAFWCDLDGDGLLEVISSCEGRNRTVFIHHLRELFQKKSDLARTADPGKDWTTTSIDVTVDREMWMYAESIDADSDGTIEVVVGSKGQGAGISLLRRIPNESGNQELAGTWHLHRLSRAGWIMSIRVLDMDGDGDPDVLVSDRNGPDRGVRWLENPGGTDTFQKSWKSHLIGGENHEVMFLDIADLDNDGLPDIGVATREGELLVFRNYDFAVGQSENIIRIANPDSIHHGKAVRFGDLNGDGHIDVAHTTNTGSPQQAAGRSGVHWLPNSGNPSHPFDAARWIPVSDARGRKFDRIELADLDGDNDLDLITCEEQDNLGLIWYENPFQNPAPTQ